MAHPYFIASNGNIGKYLDEGAVLFMPPEGSASAAWMEYQEWLAAGNTPDPAPAAEATPDYQTFWAALLQTDAYQAIRAQSAASLPMNTAATEFIALLGDAKMGMAIEPAIQMAIYGVLSAGTFTEDHLVEFQAALEAGHLDSIYSLQPPTP